MAQNYSKLDITQRAIVHTRVPVVSHPPRNFELPKRLYAVTAGCYLGFLAITGVAVSTPGLLIPLAICAIIIGMFFAVPSLWAVIGDEGKQPPLRWSVFKREGIATHTGRLDAKAAIAQMLVLPVLILAWGVTIAMIVAFAA